MITTHYRFVRPAAMLLLAALLGACTITDKYPGQPAVAIGSQVRLNLDSDIPIDQDRIYIQDQRMLSLESVDTGRVYCSVVMQRHQQAGQPRLSVKSGEFKVSRVRLSNDYRHKPVIYANTDDNYYLPSFGVDYRTELHLRSTAQPELRGIYCTRHQIRYQPNQGPYPARDEIESAMGDLLEIV